MFHSKRKHDESCQGRDSIGQRVSFPYTWLVSEFCLESLGSNLIEGFDSTDFSLIVRNQANSS